MKKLIAVLLLASTLIAAAQQLTIESAVPSVVLARENFTITSYVADDRGAPRRASVLVLVRRSNGEPFKAYRFVTGADGIGSLSLSLPCRGSQQRWEVRVMAHATAYQDFSLISVQKGVLKAW